MFFLLYTNIPFFSNIYKEYLIIEKTYNGFRADKNKALMNFKPKQP